MKKTVIKATGICVLSAVLATGYGFQSDASTLNDTPAAGITAALDKYYETTEADLETAAAEIASLTKKEIVSVVKGFNKLGVANVDTWLNVREEPNEEAEIVGKMPKNAASEVIEVAEDAEDWFLVKSGKVTGYVKADFLLTDEAANQKAEEVKKMVATVNTTTLKVRTEATTESKVLTLVPIEEELEVVEDLGDWVKITIDNEEGYISREFADISYELPRAVTVTELKYGEGVSDVRVGIVQYAKQFLGNPYVWGGTSLTNGADCSGFVLSLMSKYGVYLPRTSSAQSTSGSAVELGSVLPGDLIFYGNGSGSINHVAMYIGNGQVIHASNPSSGIKISNMYYRTPVRARRFLG